MRFTKTVFWIAAEVAILCGRHSPMPTPTPPAYQLYRLWPGRPRKSCARLPSGCKLTLPAGTFQRDAACYLSTYSEGEGLCRKD